MKLKLILVFAVLMLIVACTTPVPVLKATPVPGCPIDPSLEVSCESPVLLVEGETFDQALAKDAVIRKELRECRAKHQILVEALATCNEQVKTYNEAMKKIQP